MDGGASGNNKLSVTAITSSNVAVSAPTPGRLHCEDGAACAGGAGGVLILPWTPCPCRLSVSVSLSLSPPPLRPLIRTHCRERLMVGVEFLGAMHAPVWTQPRPHPPAPLHGPAPQLPVSEGAKRAQEGVMISICEQ